MILTDMIFNSTIRGASHIEASRECQDCSATWQNRSGDIRIAVVSDGHGGDLYVNSATGARIACRVAMKVLKEVSASVKRLPEGMLRVDGFVRAICRAIVARWNKAVEGLKGRGCSKTFGCTLIAFLQTPEYWLAIQVGDGKFTIFRHPDRWEHPVPWDDRCILNFTTSLSDDDAINEFRYAVGDAPADAVFLSSDGIDTTFDDGELLYNFFEKVITSAETSGKRKCLAELRKALAHFSKIGSRDDMSLAVIINEDVESDRIIRQA